MSTDITNREIVITRVVRAPRELVFKAFTQREHIGKWWGPNGFTTTVHSMDVRVGGEWVYTMHGPDGVDYPNHVAYLEIVVPEKLVYWHGATANDPERFHVTITFEPQSGRTLVTLRTLFSTAEQCEAVKRFGAIEGGQQTLARLSAFIEAQS